MLAVTSITFFFVAGLCEINKNSRENATNGPSPVQKMFTDRTKTMLNRRGPRPGPGPVLSLSIIPLTDSWSESVR